LRYYTATEAAAILGVTPKTLVNWLRKGEIRAKKKGRAYRLTENQLEEIRRKMVKEREKVLDEGRLSEKSGNQDTISAQLNNLSGRVGKLEGMVEQIDKRLSRFEMEFWVGWVTLIGFLISILLRL